MCTLAPRANADRNDTAPGMFQAGTILFTYFTTTFTNCRLGKRNKSPIWVVMTCLTCVEPIAWVSTLAKFSTMTIASAPESFS